MPSPYGATFRSSSPSAALRTKGGAHERDRTADLVLTKDVLCRLSYVGAIRAHRPIQRYSAPIHAGRAKRFVFRDDNPSEL